VQIPTRVNIGKGEAMALSQDARKKIEEYLAYHAKRCPHCQKSIFTSDLEGNHKCFACGNSFTDETALPSLAAEQKIIE